MCTSFDLQYPRNVAPSVHLVSIDITTTSTMTTTTSDSQKSYYHEDIDFAALGLQDEDFAALLRSNDGRIDWQDPLAVQYVSMKPLRRRAFKILIQAS